VDIQVFLAPLVKEAVFFPVCAFGTFVKNQIAVLAWDYFWTFYSIPLAYLFYASTMLFLLL
jgi:hypothetical protein